MVVKSQQKRGLQADGGRGIQHQVEVSVRGDRMRAKRNRTTMDVAPRSRASILNVVRDGRVK